MIIYYDKKILNKKKRQNFKIKSLKLPFTIFSVGIFYVIII